MTDRELPEELRKAVFRAIVEEQDKGGGPNAARSRAAKRFGVTQREARAIESEGLANDWPPLDED
jgi:hypothetical protein